MFNLVPRVSRILYFKNIINLVCFFAYRHGVEINKVMNEMESRKELLLTYEQTLTHKDSIVANITNAIHKQVCCMLFRKLLTECNTVNFTATRPSPSKSKDFRQSYTSVPYMDLRCLLPYKVRTCMTDGNVLQTARGSFDFEGRVYSCSSEIDGN